MKTPFEANIEITKGGGKGARIKAWVMSNPNQEHPNRYIATPVDGSDFPDGSKYINNGRWTFI